MHEDQKWSRSLYNFASASSRKRDTAIFCASELIWLLVGFALGRVFPSIQQVVPVLFLPWGVSLLLSEWIRRSRPFHTQQYKPLIHLFVETPSLPSSHSTLAFALVAAFTHDVFVWPFLLIGALFVSFGRVAVGVHYVSDVIVGAFIGFGLGYAVRVAAILFLI